MLARIGDADVASAHGDTFKAPKVSSTKVPCFSPNCSAPPSKPASSSELTPLFVCQAVCSDVWIHEAHTGASEILLLPGAECI